MARNERYFRELATGAFLVVFLINRVKGQGAGPIGGSIADYYDQAFGNPFLGYWKNPGNKNPYGSHTAYGGIGGDYGGISGRGSPYGSPYASGLDRPAPAAPSYLYDRLGPNGMYGGYPGANSYGGMATGGFGGYGGYGGGYGGGYAGGGYGVGGYGGVYPGGGFYPGGGMYPPLGLNEAGGRTPADRGLQDLLPSSYAYKPWYP